MTSPCCILRVELSTERSAFTLSTAAGPPRPSSTLVNSAVPLATDSAVAVGAAGAAAATSCVAAPSGMVMSMLVTFPNESSGRSCPFDGPTTRIASWSLWMYCFATRATSAGVTFSMLLRYVAR